MQVQTSTEKRRHPRAPVGVFVRVKSGEGGGHYYSENLSPGGIFLLAELPPEVETRMRMELFLPMVDTPVKAEGEVAWIQRQEPSGFAVRFTEISDSARDLIRVICDRFIPRPA